MKSSLQTRLDKRLIERVTEPGDEPQLNRRNLLLDDRVRVE
jgi:hypothetical protein